MNLLEFKSRLNQHLTHLESLVTLGVEGLEEINDKIDKFLGSLSNSESELIITQKIDGAPAVIMWSQFEGYPENSICLKSFLTSNNNCFSTEEDIMAKYGDRPSMAKKLKYCLKLAKCIPSMEAWQGDCLFTKEDVQLTTINGSEYITFLPNKIVYAVNENNAAYNSIKLADFGICFHTIYTGDIVHKLQSFNVQPSRLNHVPDKIYVMSPKLEIPKTPLTYALDLLLKKYAGLKVVEEKLLADPYYLIVCGNKAFKQYWDMFENKLLADNANTNIEQSTFYDSLLLFIHGHMKTKFDKKFASLKTDKGRNLATAKYEAELAELDDVLLNNKSLLTLMVAALNLTADIKMLMLEGFNKAENDYSTFYSTRSRGYIPAEGEGIAMSDLDGNIVKLIDRSKFSHANRDDDYIAGFEHSRDYDEELAAFAEAYR